VAVDDLAACNVATLGSGIRYHADFAPAGTNANFISVTGPQAFSIRTYERGVEAETMACGTGIVAAALIAARSGRVSAPVSVTAASGDSLTVDFTLTEDGAESVTLLGPAVHVFQGTLTYTQ
jgi:diaminopimelate epimerase